jgi:hypothetical protein
MKLLGIISVGFDVTNRSSADQIFALVRCWSKKWEYNETVHQLFINFMKAYDSVWREVLNCNLTDLGVSMKIVTITKAFS